MFAISHVVFHSFRPERGGIIHPTRRVIVSAQDLDQYIVLEPIPSPYGSDLISIENLANDYVPPANPPLINPLGSELLWLNPDGFTPTYNFVPLSVVYPMAEFETSLPSPSTVSAAMSSFPPLSGAIPTPPSTSPTSSWGIPFVSSITLMNFPHVSMTTPSSMPTMGVNHSQPMCSGFISPSLNPLFLPLS